MPYSSVCISSGHGKKIRGAAGSPIPPMLDEVDNARLLVEQIATDLRGRGVTVETYHDDVSTSQNENLNRIVDWHNSRQRELDISCHMNAFDGKAHGTEVCYLTQSALAGKLSSAIAAAGPFTNRGGKLRQDLFWLSHTTMPAVLLETCFCDNASDCQIYTAKFLDIADAIADVIGGEGGAIELPPPSSEAAFHAIGKCSHFGGPEDFGVGDSEGLAFLFKVQDKPHIFLPEGTPGTEGKGLARRLNPHTHYLAVRWDYSRTPKTMLAGEDVAMVRALKTGIALTAHPADWGPAGPESDHDTGRVADLSPSLMADLGIKTDDDVEIIYPHEAKA